MKYLIFTNARIIDPSQNLDEIGSLIIQEDSVVAIGAKAAQEPYPVPNEIIDCTGKILCPGLVDMRVFMGESTIDEAKQLENLSNEPERSLFF